MLIAAGSERFQGAAVGVPQTPLLDETSDRRQAPIEVRMLGHEPLGVCLADGQDQLEILAVAQRMVERTHAVRLAKTSSRSGNGDLIEIQTRPDTAGLRQPRQVE